MSEWTTWITDLYNHDRFAIEMLLISFLFCLPLRKRKLWGLRFAAGVLLVLTIGYLIPYSRYRYVFETLLTAG
ncbi:MAG: hypothetical protein IKQ24_04790, partial [Verrucomicrobia bacterium]|nr:hypothetical protein [Verrucomicrobiota bacterium]